MASATYTPTLSSSGVNKVWRKVQGELQDGFGFDVPEWEQFDSIRGFDIDVSAREVTVPIDLAEGAGVASIAEGALEARPSSPNVEELTLNYILLNKRFTATVTAELLDKHQKAAQLKRQLVFQGKKAMQDVARDWADRLYGLSTGYLAQTSTVATQSSGVYTLKNMYGQTSLAHAAAFPQIADKFKVGDAVALIRSGALVTNAIGLVTAVSKTTPSITVTWNGSVTSADDDYVVKANSLGNTVLGDTDYNKSMNGFIDNAVTASIHGLSHANYLPAYSDTTSTRFSGIKLRRMKDEIGFAGGGKMTKIFIGAGVYRDTLALQQAALRFHDPFALELDGDIKSKGVTFFTSKRVPAGWVFAFDAKSVRKLDVMPKPGDNITWSDGVKIPDTSGYVFSINLLTQMVWINRANTAYIANAIEQ
jgi:hypothetical protein